MTNRTLAEALEVARSGLGQWWPNPWWPGGNSTFNDCAAFVSWSLYGLNGRAPVYTFVPHLMERAIRERRWYGGTALAARPQDGRHAAGMVPGDVVILDWRFRGSRDHVGLFLGYVGTDFIRVRQANNGGGGNGNAAVRDPAEDVTYHRRFVLGYYRPPYRTNTPAGSGATPIGADMSFTYEDADPRHKQSIQRDIMGHGLKGVPDKHGVRYVPIELLIEASQRSELAMNASEALVKLITPLVQVIKDTRETQLQDSETYRATPPGPVLDVDVAELAAALATDAGFAERVALSVAERAELEQYRADRARRREQLQAELAALGKS